jgi:hypothetical protein
MSHKVFTQSSTKSFQNYKLYNYQSINLLAKAKEWLLNGN